MKQYALKIGYDGHNPMLVNSDIHITTLRNGDIRSHELIWKGIDYIMGNVFNLADFKKLKTKSDYEEYIRFKFQIISYIYNKYCKKPTIGTPIDVFSITNNKRM